ncbi:monovalent cation/H(+) antiporter subunit G [Geomicrobium sp. JCM 19039]|uniref:monovalent cation/H(+) antiporter subunit G n=1 Tax=Geomicrobium sp. JCM 19039 TaxID=1460636 RepID=UPI00045F1F24|nr:Na(+) H(+) antiporter subunit G [Geomicrobium sp. JCM 19039]
MIEILISICIILGVFLSLIGSIGILRLKDAYGRMHAATKSATLGIIFVIIGTFFMFLMRGELLLQLLFAIVFVFLTAPVAAMIISRSAHRIGVELWENTEIDELHDSYPEHVKPTRSDVVAEKPSDR